MTVDVDLDTAIRSALSDIVAAAPTDGDNINPTRARPSAVSRAGLTAAAIVIILAGLGALMLTIRATEVDFSGATANTSAAATTPAVAPPAPALAPSTVQPPPFETTPVTILCHQEGSDGEIANAQLENLSAEVATLDERSVGIVVTDSETAQQWVGGCMSEDTAEYSRANGLSLAHVAPVRGGVFVAVAVPEGRDLALPDSVIRSRSTNPTRPNGFDLVVLDAERVAALTDPALSAAQLQGLIAMASTDGTASTAGIGADLLEAA